MAPLLIPLIGKVLDTVLPDPQAQAEAKIRLLELAQKPEAQALEADVKLALGQIGINQVEAQGEDRYTKRWRPTIGYIIAAALAFQYILNPLFLWGAAISGYSFQAPQITLDQHLWELIMGMLGLAGWRTIDKIKAGVK